MGIFVSYSWVDKKPDMNVLKLVNRLREYGHDVKCDVMDIQAVSSINFIEMMAKNLKSARKVIVVLSEEYKRKADSFSNGVGNEYRYILNDMQINEEKYILVSFLPLTVENCARIIPDFLKGRDIIDLSKGITGDSRLLYRLTDTNEYDFSPVSPRKVIPKPIYIGELESGSVSGEEINNLRKRSKRMRAYQSQSNLFHLGGKVLRFIPIIGSWNYKEDEYYLGDIIVKTNQSRYTLPNEILEVFNKMNNIREQEKKSTQLSQLIFPNKA